MYLYIFKPTIIIMTCICTFKICYQLFLRFLGMFNLKLRHIKVVLCFDIDLWYLKYVWQMSQCDILKYVLHRYGISKYVTHVFVIHISVLIHFGPLILIKLTVSFNIAASGPCSKPSRTKDCLQLSCKDCEARVSAKRGCCTDLCWGRPNCCQEPTKTGCPPGQEFPGAVYKINIISILNLLNVMCFWLFCCFL